MNNSLMVAVLMGGPSAEHDISLKSGRGVVEALTKRQWTVQPLVIPKTFSVAASCAFVEQAFEASHPDVAFIALHGTFGEDGTMQALCERLHIAYTGSDAASSRLGMDKVASRRRFEEIGLMVPRWQLINMAQSSRLKAEGNSLEPSTLNLERYHQPSAFSLQLPLVVKPSNQGSSLGVSLVRREDEFEAALSAAGHYGSPVIVEEFIVGREMTVGILDEEPLPVVEIRPRQPFFDYTAKYTAGVTDYLVPAILPPATAARVQAAGLAAHRALGCRHLSRTDLILTHREEPVVLEINTIPGFTPTSLLPKAAACGGCSYEELCERIVMMAWQGSAHLVRP